ncbi:HTH-type transcriptional regulator HexR [Nocardia cerradoensis]|uniref:HTH-type transcriptional regulator HexR n=1 Tax=Nocardia cerradoensis TaxID=85688 RepID=A0A231GZN9_9NOCA|nr:MurR/RpiR family transcriptional regulator [Nocardia cerradoensis]OXR42069.1 HTH-type transcriptional regulator HexR [Nocardia cerradoensis]
MTQPAKSETSSAGPSNTESGNVIDAGGADPGARGATVSERIRARAGTLSPAGNRVAQILREQPATVLGMSVGELASQSDTSVGSVVRFSQELGFRGFQELKLQLAGDISTRPPARDKSIGLPGAIFLETAQALSQAVSALDTSVFHRAVTVLDGAHRVLVAGVGTSQPVAADAAYRLQLAGLMTASNPEVHSQHVSAALLGTGDACFTVSHSGQTQETLAITAAAREAGATTIGLTSFARTPLADVCDVVLVAGSAETDYRLEAMTSRFLHLAVVDALYVALSERNPERAEQAHARTLRVVARHRL